MRKLSCYGRQARCLAHWVYLLAGSGDSALYVLRDRRCADRQCDLVVYEGKLMGENVLSDLGVQKTLAGNQAIDGTQEHPNIFSAQLWRQILQEHPLYIGVFFVGEERDIPCHHRHSNDCLHAMRLSIMCS